MIDGIKTGNIIAIKESDLDWYVSANERTGEVKEVKVANSNGLTFIQKSQRVYLKGSLHMFFNEGKHNHNNFSFASLRSVITELHSKYGINPQTTPIENLEFGVNVELPYAVDKILNSLVMHKSEPFNKFVRGQGLECNHTQYSIKIYDKGKQHNLKQNLLRVEIKVVRMAYFASQGVKIKFLSDLLKIENLKDLSNILVQTISDVILTDVELLKNPALSEEDRLIIANGSNHKYWRSIKPKSSNYILGNKDPDFNRRRKSYHKELKRFKETNNRFGGSLNSDIVKRVEHKCSELIVTDIRDNFTDPKGVKGTTLPLVYSVNLSSSKKECLVTGYDISMQKPESRFLNVTGIRYYQDNFPDIYLALEENYLTDKWENAPANIKHKKIAHLIRSKVYTPRNHYKKMMDNRGPMLFDDTPYYSELLKKSFSICSNQRDI